jgi:hypothetical protein
VPQRIAERVMPVLTPDDPPPARVVTELVQRILERVHQIALSSIGTDDVAVLLLGRAVVLEKPSSLVVLAGSLSNRLARRRPEEQKQWQQCASERARKDYSIHVFSPEPNSGRSPEL